MSAQRRWTAPALWVSFVAGFSCPLSAQPMFRIIEPPPNSPVSDVTVHGISGNGNLVVGCGFYWTLDKGSVSLSDLPGGSISSCAYSASMDGSIIVGQGTPSAGVEAVRWVYGSIEGLGDLQGGIPTSRATDVSLDGSVVVGGGFNQAFRWSDGAMFGLGNLPGGSGSFANAVSNDGSVIVGYGISEEGSLMPFRWKDNQLVALDILLETTIYGVGTGVSGDGRVVVGWSDHTTNPTHEAFKWEDGVLAPLGFLPNATSSYAWGISASATIIVGESGGNAFIWDEVNGMRDLKAVLQNDLGLNLGSWKLVRASAVSFDGLTVVGLARSESNPRVKGFVARLGYLETADADGDGVPDSLDACENTIGGVPVDTAGCPPKFPTDLDRDGDSDLADLALLLRCWGGPDIPIEPACLNGE